MPSVVTSRSLTAMLRKVERNAKEKLVFLLISETKDLCNTLYLQVKELPHKVKKLRNNE